ncbi:MAG TPA: hypothetical protein IGS37_15625 [Synechococcales cyanobacterium M55_K2018_004]|nr:hypothetical protein [Synechococcales cyanobacterium M55_K2018_004]
MLSPEWVHVAIGLTNPTSLQSADCLPSMPFPQSPFQILLMQLLPPRWRQPLAVAVLAMLATPAIAQAQPYEGRFRGNSAFWRPDYVGTLQMEQRGNYNFTATADVELQRVTDQFPDPAIAQYEMRGEIRITSAVTIRDAGSSYTCRAVSPVPVQIAGSRLMVYSGDEDYPRNSYEIRVFQYVRLTDCVGPGGNRIERPGALVEVNFDSSQMAIDARPPSREPPLPEAPNFTPAEQAILEQQQRAADEMANNPEFQREMQRLQQQAIRTGRPPSDAEALAVVERLRRSGAIPREVPTLSPERQAQLEQQFLRRAIDYSHLRRFTTVNQLQDRVSVTTPAGQTLTFAWNLRRVNAR